MSELASQLQALGFRGVQSRRGSEWVHQASQYLTFSVHEEQDGLLFTWELAIGELMSDRGLQIGSNDPLNIFLFPQADVRGPADVSFIEAEMRRTRAMLGSIDLASS